MQTKIYGFYTPIRKIFGDKIDRIRHVITPSVSFNYHPDFGDPMFKFYNTYTQKIIDKNSFNRVQFKEVTYSPYSRGMYGVPGRGTSGSVGFSIANNLEMKVKDTSDSTKVNAYKKIILIDIALGIYPSAFYLNKLYRNIYKFNYKKRKNSVKYK